MHRIHRARIVFALLLLVAFAVLPAWGGELRSREEARSSRLAAFARSAATLFWGQLTGLWEKEGCVIDPHGGCMAGRSQAEAGCILDPHGACVAGPSTVEVDAGCIIDPNGGCTAGK